MVQDLISFLRFQLTIQADGIEGMGAALTPESTRCENGDSIESKSPKFHFHLICEKHMKAKD